MHYVDFCCSEVEENKLTIIKELCSSSIPLIELIEQAKDDLLSQSENDRATGIEFVSLISLHYPNLGRTDKQFLFEFLSGKLVECLAIQSLLAALIHLIDESPNKIGQILSAIYLNYNVKNERQQTRKLFYTLFFESLKSSTSITSQDLSFLLEMIEGEKDPRNLVIIFPILSFVGKNFDNICKQNIDAFLEASFCYFPISFTPPPNDPYGITEELLKHLLGEALLSCEITKVFDLMLNKLSTFNILSKIETFDFLSNNFDSFEGVIFTSLDLLMNQIIFDFKVSDNLNFTNEQNTLLAACHKLLECILKSRAVDEDILEKIYSHVADNSIFLPVFGKSQRTLDFVIGKILLTIEVIPFLIEIVENATNLILPEKIFDFVFLTTKERTVFNSPFVGPFTKLIGLVINSFPNETLLNEICNIYSMESSIEIKVLIIKNVFMKVKNQKLLWNSIENLFIKESEWQIFLPLVKSSKFISQCILENLKLPNPANNYKLILSDCIEYSDQLLEDLQYFLTNSLLLESDFLRILVANLHKSEFLSQPFTLQEQLKSIRLFWTNYCSLEEWKELKTLQSTFPIIFKYLLILFCNKFLGELPSEISLNYHLLELIGVLIKNPELSKETSFDISTICSIIEEFENNFFDCFSSSCCQLHDNYKQLLYEIFLPTLLTNHQINECILVCKYVKDESKLLIFNYCIESCNTETSTSLLKPYLKLENIDDCLKRLVEKVFKEFSSVQSVEMRLSLLDFIQSVIQNVSSDDRESLQSSLLKGISRVQNDHKRIVRQSLANLSNTLHLRLNFS